MIFHSKEFVVSKHGNVRMVLCLRDYPNERFLISFPSFMESTLLMMEQMPNIMQASGMRCEFPNVDEAVMNQYLGN